LPPWQELLWLGIFLLLTQLRMVILCLIPPDGYMLTRFIKKTGLTYKPDVIYCINTLEDARLITKTKQGKQKKIVKLSNLGQEFTDLINHIHQLDESYSELKKLEKGIFGIIPRRRWSGLEAAERFKLRDKGLTNEQIESYTNTRVHLSLFLDEIQSVIINTLTIRYTSIVSSFKLDRIASVILDKLAMDEISRLFQIVLEDIRTKATKYYSIGGTTEDIEKSNWAYKAQADRALNHLRTLLSSPKSDVLSNNLTNEQTKTLIASVLSLLNPAKDFLEIYIKGLNHEITKFHREKSGLHDKRDSLYMNTLKQLLIVSQQVYNKLR
jgi:predicted transcriptional regulator